MVLYKMEGQVLSFLLLFAAAPISKTNLIYFLQYPVNGARGPNGQNAA